MSSWGINADAEEIDRPDDIPTKPTEEHIQIAGKAEMWTNQVAMDVLERMTELAGKGGRNVVRESINSLAYIGMTQQLMSMMGTFVKNAEKNFPKDQAKQEAEVVRVTGLVLKEIIKRGGELEEINNGKV